jgi:two-component system, OmpR family, sensor kinase
VSATPSRADPGAGRRALPLAWRGAALASAAIGVLVVVASLTSFVVVRDSLRATLQRALRDDARRVADLYRTGAAGSARDQLAGPTGGVIVQLYDPLGSLLVATEPRYARTDAAIPRTALAQARDLPQDWRGTLAGRTVQAALTPFEFGVVAVVGDTAYIGESLTRLGRALAVTAAALVVLSAVVGSAVAAAIVRPIRRLAQAAQRLGPDHLEPIPDVGPWDEVGALTEVLNALIGRLRASLDAQRAFLAETSHELRTPLTSLRGFLERASRKADPEVRRDLDDALRVAAGMSRLVADLLQLSRGEVVREADPFLLDPVTDVLRPVAEEFPGMRVEGETGALVLGDPARLVQLVRNLAVNAVRVAGASGVTLRGRVEGDEVVLEVHDVGPGVPEELQAKVFEKFWTSGGGGGVGLGLAIARQVARAHGSELSLESRPGDTTFSVRLARMELSDDDEGA